MNEYIKTLPYGDLMYHLTGSWPIILWIFYGYHLSKHLVSPRGKIGKRISKSISFPLNWLHTLVWIIWLIPIILILRTMFYAILFDEKKWTTEYEPGKPTLPPGFGYCMNTNIKQEDKAKGILAYWDYACEGSNEKFTTSAANALLTRFYYINYAIFLIVLLVYNTLSKVNILKNKFVLLNIRFALFLGIIGCILPVFASGFYLRSQWMTTSWSSLLSMNACCFMLIGLAVMSYGSLFEGNESDVY